MKSNCKYYLELQKWNNEDWHKGWLLTASKKQTEIKKKWDQNVAVQGIKSGCSSFIFWEIWA